MGSEQVLHNLYSAGNLERLEKITKQYLSNDPHHTTALYYLILALINLGRGQEAKTHLESLSALEPDSQFTLTAAVSLYRSLNRLRKAREYIADGLRLYPYLAFFHYHAAAVDCDEAKIKSAKKHISKARELAPDSADIANLFIQIHSFNQTTLTDALAQIEAFKEALKLEPENAALHHNIGLVYLDDLDDPCAAEKHFREALRIYPSDKDFKENLFRAIACRSLLYRLVSIPSRTIRSIIECAGIVRKRPWHACLVLFLTLICFKFFLIAMLWFFLTTLFFWPSGLVYEWLLVSEIRNANMVSDRKLQLWHRIQRWPTMTRFALFLGFNMAVWAGIFSLLTIPLKYGFPFVAGLTILNFLFVWGARGRRRYKAKKARRKSLLHAKTRAH